VKRRARTVALTLLLATGFAVPGWPQQRRDEARTRDVQGVALAEAGRIAEAVEQFRAALELDPAYPEAVYHLALADERAGRTDEAMALAENALRLSSDFTAARYLLAACCRKRGDFEGELHLLEKVAASAPDFAEARYNYGLGLQREQRFVEAVEELRAAARLDPKNGRYVLALGVALANRNNDEALGVLRAAVELAPSDAEAHYNLALALAASGAATEAIREFEGAVRFNPRHAGARRGLGITLMHEDKLDAAVEELRRALRDAPRDEEAANNLGLAQLRLNDVSGAIASLKLAIELNPRLIKAHFNLAQAYRRAGRLDDSRRETERAGVLTAEQRSVGQAMVLVQSARQRLQSGDRAGALSALRDAVAASPGFADGHLTLGRVILETGGDVPAAVREFRVVLNLDPERAEAHYRIGLALLKTDQKTALEEFGAASSMAPCRVEIMRALAAAAFDAGDWSTAATQLRRVLAWSPMDKEALIQLERVRAHSPGSPAAVLDPRNQRHDNTFSPRR
jgi:protein O-GlcNAc transferase